MNKRPIKEILELMLKYPERLDKGLCLATNSLFNRGILSVDEYLELKIYIRDHRPSPYSSIKAFFKKNSPLYWPYGDAEPRIKWIKKHIKINSK